MSGVGVDLFRGIWHRICSSPCASCLQASSGEKVFDFDCGRYYSSYLSRDARCVTLALWLISLGRCDTERELGYSRLL
jgi:hypothetical protein